MSLYYIRHFKYQKKYGETNRVRVCAIEPQKKLKYYSILTFQYV